MTFKMNTASRNDLASQFVTDFPASSTLTIRTGSAPGPNNTATGTVLATITLPASPWATPSSGAVGKNGTWEDTSADATGTAAHFRLVSADGTKIVEGTVTATGGGGDMTVDNTSFAAGQDFLITGFTVTFSQS